MARSGGNLADIKSTRVDRMVQGVEGQSHKAGYTPIPLSGLLFHSFLRAVDLQGAW